MEKNLLSLLQFTIFKQIRIGCKGSYRQPPAITLLKKINLPTKHPVLAYRIQGVDICQILSFFAVFSSNHTLHRRHRRHRRYRHLRCCRRP